MGDTLVHVDPVVQSYVEERDRHLNTINVFKQQARERGKDPSDEDLETIDRCKKRIKKLDELIDTLGDNMEMSQEMRDKLSRSAPGLVPSVPKYRSAGEIMWDCVHAEFGSQHDRDDQDAKRRWKMVMERTAQHMGTTAEATKATAGGFGGLYVAPVVGPVIDLSPKSQPFLNTIGKQPAPNALTFTRPRIVDPNFKTGAAQQSYQKDELTSVKFDVKVDNLTLATFGGYLNVSQQLLSLHPGAWDIILNQLQKRVAWQGEAGAVAAVAQTTASVNLTDPTDPEDTLAALYDAAALVYTNTNELPTWLVMGPIGWANLGKLTDLGGRPLFPFIGAANAMGTMDLGSFGIGPLGLNAIVSPGITTNDLWMGNSSALEAYAYQFPVLEAIEPSVLGRQVAVAEALAFYRPTTKEAVTGDEPEPAEGNGAVKINVT